MPPDPILALLCAVGLLAYAGVGGVVGALSVNLFGGDVGDLVGWNRDRQSFNAVDGFMFAAVFWPITLVVVLCYGLAVCPAFIAKRVGRYVAGSLDK